MHIRLAICAKGVLSIPFIRFISVNLENEQRKPLSFSIEWLCWLNAFSVVLNRLSNGFQSCGIREEVGAADEGQLISDSIAKARLHSIAT